MDAILAGDNLECSFFGEANPLVGEPPGVEALLDAIDAHAAELTPQRARVAKSEAAYSREAVRRLLGRKRSDGSAVLSLSRSDHPAASLQFSFLGGKSPIGLWLWVLVPFAYFRHPERGAARSQAFVSLVRALALACPPVYAWAHNQADASLASDPTRTDPFATRRVNEAYWLTILGAKMIRKLGKDRVLATPAAHVEELPAGGVLLLTRPTPVDYASDQAREAQARVLAHLRPDLKLETILAHLAERSAALAPTQRDWDPDIEDLLELTLRHVEHADRQRETLKLNAYRPPAVDEWRPLGELLEPDVPDVEAAVGQYGEYAEQLAMLLHDRVPEVMKGGPESLPQIDYYFWRHRYPDQFRREDIDGRLIPAIGGYLGNVLVRHLGGRWVPRRDLDQAQVVLGDRAWLPFLRARRSMQSSQSILDRSLTKFFRTAARHAGRLEGSGRAP